MEQAPAINVPVNYVNEGVIVVVAAHLRDPFHEGVDHAGELQLET